MTREGGPWGAGWVWEGTQDLGEHREGLGEHREGLEEHREGMGEHREVVVGSTCLLGPERERKIRVIA